MDTGCGCLVTLGGTIVTTSITGVMDPQDPYDDYQFIFTSPVASFTVTPTSPSVFENDDYGVFDILIYDETFNTLGACNDCWYSGGQAVAENLAPGTYYVTVMNTNGFGLGDAQLPASLALGDYALQVDIDVPEPASMALFGVGIAGLLLRRCSNRARSSFL